MPALVVDASIALAWCLDDEHRDDADRALEVVAVDGAVVPAVWPLEMANGLRSAERRGRLAAADLPRLRLLLEALPIVIDRTDLATAIGGIVDLARAHDLSAYDASYVALALGHDLPMATSDERLRAACERAGVRLLT